MVHTCTAVVVHACTAVVVHLCSAQVLHTYIVVIVTFGRGDRCYEERFPREEMNKKKQEIQQEKLEQKAKLNSNFSLTIPTISLLS